VAGPVTQTVNGTTSGSGATPTGGSSPLALTIDSSSYTTIYGQKVTFIVRLTGGSSPTGTVSFTDAGAPISGCSAVPVAGGTASCATTTLVRGSHTIRGNYSGDAANGSGVAGPITQKVM